MTAVDDRTASAFKTMFGAAHVCTRQLRRGAFSQRMYDRQIATELILRAADAPAEQGVDIIEFASGRSYGDGTHVGSPWLSRVLTAALGPRLRISVTDLNSRNTVYFVAPNGGLFPVYESFGLPVSSVTVNDSNSLVAGAIPFRDIAGRLTTRESKLLYDEILRKTGCNAKRQGQLYVRPSLDAKFEGHYFHLNVVSGVDYTRLNPQLNSGGFDFVFGRHLEPSNDSGKTQCEIEALRLLRVDGGYLINFDTSLFVYNEHARLDPDPRAIPFEHGCPRSDLIGNVFVRYTPNSVRAGLYTGLSEATRRHESRLTCESAEQLPCATGWRGILDRWRFS